MNHKEMLKYFAVPVSAAFILGIGHQVVLADETEPSMEPVETVDTEQEPSQSQDINASASIASEDVNPSATVAQNTAPVQNETAWIGQQGFSTVEEAVKASKDGDTITLSEGRFTLYNVPNINAYTKGKLLTFVGQGIDKTYWGIGATIPDPSKFGTEYNGDYSFDGAKTITFKDLTLQSKAATDYLGFIRIDDTIVDHCKINGETLYWGYKSATFTNTMFDDIDKGYAIWTYSSPVMTFDSCTFHGAGKFINVYTDHGAGKQNIVVNVNNCTFVSQKQNKSALNINDSNMGDFKYIINFTGHNTTQGIKPYSFTCSRLFGFSSMSNNTGRLVVNMDGVPIWQKEKMVSHSIDTANDKYTDGYKDNAFNYTYDEWIKQEDGSFKRHVKRVCQYCGYVEEYEETKSAQKPSVEPGSNESKPQVKPTSPTKTVAGIVPTSKESKETGVNTGAQTNIGMSILGIFVGMAGLLGWYKKSEE